MDQEVAEFVKFDHAVAVLVKLFKQSTNVPSVDADLKLDQHCRQLIGCQHPILVGVKLSKDVPEDQLLCTVVRKVKEFVAHGLGKVLDLLLGDRFTLVFAHTPD